MAYAKIKDDGTVVKYPYTRFDLHKDYPSVSLADEVSDSAPEFLTTEGIFWVQQTEAPKAGIFQVVQETGIEPDGSGGWRTKWEVVDEYPEYVDEFGVLRTQASQELNALRRFKVPAADKVKGTAQEKITALAWRIERAQERDKIGAEGESVGEVLAEREAIRRASNRAETELEALTTIEEIEAFAWEVLPSDYPSNPVVTRLGFMRRFTDAERASIRAARDSGQSQDLLDFWELLQLSTNVNLNDADIELGVNMLESEGLIGTGRATEVLTV